MSEERKQRPSGADNDRRIKRVWADVAFDRETLRCYSCTLAEASDASATVKASVV